MQIRDVADRELVNTAEVCAMLGLSRTTFDKFRRSGRLPRPKIEMPRLVRWSRSELERWVAAGCPAQTEWEATKRGETGPSLAG